jgi:hypothetical protein
MSAWLAAPRGLALLPVTRNPRVAEEDIADIASGDARCRTTAGDSLGCSIGGLHSRGEARRLASTHHIRPPSLTLEMEYSAEASNIAHKALSPYAVGSGDSNRPVTLDLG